MAYHQRDAVRLYYETTEPREGLPVLLTHGFGASTGMWQGQVERFRDAHQMISWDMRGHGLTECPNDPACFSQPETVADMLAILDANEVDRAVIAGHSLGGFMSLAFYVSHPDRVAALILQGCGPGYRSAESRAKWNERAEMRAVTIEQGGLDALGGASEVGVSVQRSAQGLANAARGILSQVDSRQKGMRLNSPCLFGELPGHTSNALK